MTSQAEESSSQQRTNGAVGYTSEGRSTLEIGNGSSGPTRKRLEISEYGRVLTVEVITQRWRSHPVEPCRYETPQNQDHRRREPTLPEKKQYETLNK